MSPAMTVIEHVDRLLTLDPSRPGGLGVVVDGTVILEADRVAWVGASSDRPAVADGARRIDGRGTVGLPGLVDCHTHSVWAGSRAGEWRRRLSGASYSQILEEGGGILSTVRATRAASFEQLVDDCAGRLAEALDRGITTVEVKSGYGLTAEHERRCLEAAGIAGQRVGVRIHRTFLGAHTVPAELRQDREAYVQQVIEEQIPAVVGLADDIDIYVDRGAFTIDEARRILRAGADAGLGIRIHAEQIAHTGAAALGAELGARSADHLERLDKAGVDAMAAAGTVAVLLPGAMLYLRDAPPPVSELREAGVPMAVATDLNPGTSPTGDLWGCATLACVTMGLTVEEALAGITRNAARALGRDDLGRLAPGCLADVVLMGVPAGEPVHEDVLVQRLQGHRARLVVAGGAVVRGG